jgi:glycosyltransferase involved in cell wall biosynthesis
MVSKNILYIGDPSSIHDFKWITFFSQKEEFNCFLIGEVKTCSKLSNEQEQTLAEHGIKLLPAINDFSFSKPLATIKAILRLRRIIKENEIDTVHALFGSPQPIWFNFLAKGGKLIITNRGSDVLVLIKGLFESRKILLNNLLYKLIKRGFRKANYVTCTSSKQIDYLRKDIVDSDVNLTLIKTGVDVRRIEKHSERCELDLPLDKQLVFSIRYIGEVYNMDYQIAAIKQLPLDLKKSICFLFIKGGAVSEVFYDDFISKLEMIDDFNYQIFDSLSQLEIWSLIKKSDLIYMVPKSDGTPNSALETMASRKPFIMGDLDYNKELFDEVSLIAKLNSPKSLADNIAKGLLSYPINFLDNGFEKVTNFGSREAEMKKLLKLYTK